jgi:hypothetical protein
LTIGLQRWPSVCLPIGPKTKSLTLCSCAADRELSERALLTELQNEFQITSRDAARARDRTYGGVESAGTGNPAHRPDRSLDPFAWISFGRALDDPSIISELRRAGIVSPDAPTAIVKNEATGLPEPWSVPDERTPKGLTQELRREVRSLQGWLYALVFKGHALFGVRAEVVNRRDACDEVLVRVGEGDFGMVQLPRMAGGSIHRGPATPTRVDTWRLSWHSQITDRITAIRKGCPIRRPGVGELSVSMSRCSSSRTARILVPGVPAHWSYAAETKLGGSYLAYQILPPISVSEGRITQIPNGGSAPWTRDDRPARNPAGAISVTQHSQTALHHHPRNLEGCRSLPARAPFICVSSSMTSTR